MPTSDESILDVLIVGGGPAGLSAALVLGRSRRSVVVIDAGQPRNAASRSMNGYLTRDGIEPRQFLRLAHDEIAHYGVTLLHATVDSVRILPDRRFLAALTTGQTFTSRRILLATGVVDQLPPIPTINDYYGVSIHHCPYCDGWEHRGRRLLAFGAGNRAVGLALLLKNWSQHVTACTDGVPLDHEHADLAARNDIRVEPRPITGLEGRGGYLARAIFASGPALDCDAMFFNTSQTTRWDLALALGCKPKPDGGIFTNERQRTCVPGVFVAGDADKDVQFVIVAAAEGATAAVTINKDLLEEDRR